jgi:hypothetical protein
MAGYLLRTVYPAGNQSFPLSSQIISARPKIVTESQSLVLFSLCMKLRKSFCFLRGAFITYQVSWIYESDSQPVSLFLHLTSRHFIVDEKYNFVEKE